MSDRREQVLARLLAIAEETGLFTEVVRNKTDVTGKRRPACVILDADEAASESSYDRGRPQGTPDIVLMTPEVYLLAEKRPEDLGPALNVLRAAMIKAVKTDSTLGGILGTSGEVRYQGCQTDLGKGRQMQGEMVISFAFKYTVKHEEL